MARLLALVLESKKELGDRKEEQTVADVLRDML
jgi:hypothetical protein